MRVLITGATGFAGGHLAEALLARGVDELHGTSRRVQWPDQWRHLEGRLPLLGCDLCDPGAIESLLRDLQPEQIYHLAGYANAGQSFQEIEAAWAGNLTATRNLYEAVRRWGAVGDGRPRILYVGSGLIYGETDQACDEESPLRPANPYAASKAAADLASYQYTRFPGLEIVRVRPFNHIGPRQSPQFAVAHFAQQIAAIERGRQPSPTAPLLETGDLRPLRDLSDVRDTVEAYVLLMERGRSGEAYNVASGLAHPMQDVLERLLARAKVRLEVRQRAGLVRAVESFTVRGDAGKLRRETGWSPRYSLEQTLADTLDYWRSCFLSAEC